MLNLHDIVRGPISALHPDETVLLIQSDGVENVRGELLPKFVDALAVTAQIQSMGSDDLKSMESTARTEITRKAWLYSDTAAGLVPSPLVREFARAGDLIRRADNSWWLITSLPEDYSRSGWVAVGLTLQIEIPEPAAVLAQAWDDAHQGQP